MVEQDPQFTKGDDVMPTGTLMQARVPAAGFYSKPNDPGTLETEVLFGERVSVIERRGKYLLVESDNYATPGFVWADYLQIAGPDPTHRVIVPRAHVYLDCGFKSGSRFTLAFNSQVRICAEPVDTDAGRMVFIEGLGFLFEGQVRALNDNYPSYVELARLRARVALPYLWGSRTYPDCSGFNMDTLLACGINCPRNASEQAKKLGVQIDFDDIHKCVKTGDFVFWTEPGTKARHVATMVSGTHCAHSTISAPHRGIVEESLRDVVRSQYEAGSGMPNVLRRFLNRPIV